MGHGTTCSATVCCLILLFAHVQIGPSCHRKLGAKVYMIPSVLVDTLHTLHPFPAAVCCRDPILWPTRRLLLCSCATEENAGFAKKQELGLQTNKTGAMDSANSSFA